MKIDPDRPYTWVPYRKGLCDTCRATCCMMPVEVLAADLVRLGLADEDEIESKPARVAALLKKKAIVKSYRAATGLFMLEQKQGRDCYFLGADRRCTVYEKRPDVCRKFPEQMGRRPGYCPALPPFEK